MDEEGATSVLDDGDLSYPAELEVDVSRFKYNEDKYMAKALAYIDSTYGEHYVGADASRTQVVDLWESLGIGAPACQSNVLKYISRYGKKGGNNKNDLMKAIHYTMLLWHMTKDEVEQ